MRIDDAMAALEHGADAIVVFHGAIALATRQVR